LRFLFNIPLPTRVLFIVAAILYVGGALGGEMMQAWYASYFNEHDANYYMIAVFEESLEMAGVVIFLQSLTQILEFEFRRKKFIEES